MAFFPPLCDQEEKDAYDALSQSVEKVEFLSQMPLISNQKRLSTNVIEPCKGYHQFRVWIPIPGQAGSHLTTTIYRLIEPLSCSDTPQVCVPRCRAWPITIAFRPSVTPLDWWLRITPVFADGERVGDTVEKCRKHQTKASSSSNLRDLSFVEVLCPFAQYTRTASLSACAQEQISVCFPLDVIELFRQSRSDDAEKDLSQDQGSQSVLLPEVRKTILCTIHCYNSCLGIGPKGEIDLLITLEARRSNEPFAPQYEVLGLQKVRVRCCACPSRDAKEVRELRSRPSDSAVVSDQESGRALRKASRCLSLTIPSRRNIRARSNELKEFTDVSPEIPAAEVTIGARKYFLLLTDDPLDYSRLRESRNLRSHSSERWSGRNSRPDLKQIDRAFTRREWHVARGFALNVTTNSRNSSFSDTTAPSLDKLHEDGQINGSHTLEHSIPSTSYS